MVSFKMNISTKLHLVVADKGVFFFVKVLESPLSYDFLKQIELDDIVDNMKKFLLVNPATIAGEKGPFRQLEGKKHGRVQQWLKKGPK